MKIGIAIVMVLAVVISCRKEALNEHPELRGQWATGLNGTGDKLVLEGSNGEYYKGGEEYKGRAGMKDDKLKIQRAQMHIDQYPACNSQGDYIMILDGQTFYGAYAPGSPGIDSLGRNVVRMTWQRRGDTSTESYVLEFKPLTSSTWIGGGLLTFNQNTVYCTIGGFSASTTYEFRVKSQSWGHESAFSSPVTFTTLP